MIVISTSSVLGLIRAGKWSHVWCTSYTLSLSFFEAVILNELTANAAPKCTLLVDTDGVRSGLEELGPRHAGRLYDVEPILVDTGCFHPKILFFCNENDAHLIVGSSNLTFGGWGRNLECFEHLHASFAANAFRDMSVFFRTLAVTTRGRHMGQIACEQAARELEAHARVGHNSSDIRILHNLATPLIDQIVDIVSSLGGASRLAIISPYYDPLAVRQMCTRLKVSQALLHVNPSGTVEGHAANWPANSEDIVQAVTFDWLLDFSDRPLHAKLFEIVCISGRLLISGSANATRPALLIDGNIEVCTARIELSGALPWQYHTAEPPPPIERQISEENEGTERVRLLTGKVEGLFVSGRILEPFPEGTASVSRREGTLWESSGSVSVNGHGEFTFSLSTELSWSVGQMVLRVLASNGTQAQGFLSQPEFSSMARRLGRSARSFLSFLQGMGIPEDMSVVLQYFHQHPEDLLLSDDKSISGGGQRHTEANDSVLPVQGGKSAVFGPNGYQGDAPVHVGGSWVRFVDDLIAALTNPEPRNAVDRADDEEFEDDPTGKSREKNRAADEASRRKVVRDLTYLVERVERSDPERVNLELTLALLECAASQVKEESVQLRTHFVRVIGVAARRRVWKGDPSLVVAAYLLYAGQLRAAGDTHMLLRLRRLLLRCGWAFDRTAVPNISKLKSLRDILGVSHLTDKLWREVCETSTPQEEALTYVKNAGRAGAGYSALALSPAWNALKNGWHVQIHVYDELPRACRKCNRLLASRDRDQLRQFAAITHECGYTLLCTEV